MESQPKEIREYTRSDGSRPFTQWLDGLRDRVAQDKIAARLKRVMLGNLGNYRSVGEGGELKIDYGAGYRVYFGQIGAVVVLLLCGGDKSTQDRDIKLAKEYWRDYAERESSDQ
jgi:putative addiction module killer protein